MTEVGAFRERVRFEQRSLDVNGNRLGPWDTEGGFTRAAAFVFPALGRAGEVLQARLTGVQPVTLTVWDDAEVRTVGETESEWRAVDTRTGKKYEIKSNTPARNIKFRDLLAVETKGHET